MLSEESKGQIWQHAQEDYPRECCGVVSGGQVFRSRNLSSIPEDAFILDPLIYEAHKPDLIYHSHPKGSVGLSQADINTARASGIPMYQITLIDGDPIAEDYFDPKEWNPTYKGRRWSYGRSDCYSLVRDWFWFERGINLKDFDRGYPPEFDPTNWDKFTQGFRAAGFVPVINQPAQPGDCLLMRIRGIHPNHCGIITDPGRMLHHLRDAPSDWVPYNGFWVKATTSVLRYQSPSIDPNLLTRYTEQC